MINNNEFPTFDDKKTYVLTGTQLNGIIELMRRLPRNYGFGLTLKDDRINGGKFCLLDPPADGGNYIASSQDGQFVWTAGTALPSGAKDGDLLYWSEDDQVWKILTAPTVDSVLTFAASATAPAWTALTACP